MKFDFFVNKNKIIIISFIVLILFSFFNCNVFAGSSFDANYDYIYDFKIDNSKTFPLTYNITTGRSQMPSVSDFNNKVDYFKNKDSIVSGENFYFVYSNFGGIAGFELKRSDVSDIFISFKQLNNFNTYDFGDIKNVIYTFNVVNSDGSITKYDDINFSLDYDNHVLTTNFFTNYDKPISVHYQNSDKGSGNFFLVAPTFHLTAAVGQIPEIMTKIIQQVLPIGLIVLGIGLLIYLTRRVIFLMK